VKDGEVDEAGGDASDAWVVLSSEQLSESALRGLVEEFVTRDGTDYGNAELSLEEKVARLERQLASGDAKIVFDPESETVNVVLARELRGKTGS
jgi:uncharacterized protein YheU (UPF0270 family)